MKGSIKVTGESRCLRSVDEEHVIKAQWRSVLRVIMIQFPDNSETENS